MPKCSSCDQECGDDSTIADHGVCYDCYKEILWGEIVRARN